MIDYARPYDQNMCDMYLPPTPPAPARLDDFRVFQKGTVSYIYGSYYTNPNFNSHMEPEVETTANVYHNLMTSRECHSEDWRCKIVIDWNETDTVSWLFNTALSLGYSEYDIPFYNFKVTGLELRGMKREEVQQRMMHLNVDPEISRRLGDIIYEKLQDMISQFTVLRYAESSDPYSNDAVQTVLDLDSLGHKNRQYLSDYKPNDSSILQGVYDSSDDAEDVFRTSEPASPEYSYGSDGSKSGDEDDKRKIFKRPPGRPKGSGRKVCKRPRTVSVPEFLRDLLLNPKHCPSIIKWEDYSQGKFRFVKPDEVAKLWGHKKQNDLMTFEKFSRAMRYHYRQSVLVSVPTARLVYQFGLKGPDYKTDNPNFTKVKSELENYDMYS